MKILIRGFLGKRHSWCVVGWGIAQALIDLRHSVSLFSTDGVEHLPTFLSSNLIGYTEENQTHVFGRVPGNYYDAQISYTCMKNFAPYLSSGYKNRFGIWVYEWSGLNSLPNGFAKNYRYCDYLCAPSNFGKKIFMESGIPEGNIKVIPHGITAKDYEKTNTITLPTKKKYKILSCIAQNQLRKNIPGLLDAYGKAFTNQDDVCLILKAKDKPVKLQFDVSLKECLDNFYHKYPRHAEVKLFSDFLPDISALYRSVDTVYSMSFAEGFYFPGLEGIASGKLSIAPNYGGHLDFLNSTNSLLVSGKEVRADPKSMYWEAKTNATWFQPNIDDAVAKLNYAYKNYETMNDKINKQRSDIYRVYDWGSVARQFLELCK